MPNWIQNNIQIIVIFVMMTLSFLSWLGKQLGEQQKKRKAELDRERRILEELRTGRTDTPQATAQTAAPQPTAQESLEEIAARRRAAMADLQRRQQQAGPVATPAPPTRQPAGQPARQAPARQAPARQAPRRQEMAPGQARQREDLLKAQGRAIEMAQVNAARAQTERAEMLEEQQAQQQANVDRQQRLRQQEAELALAARPARVTARPSSGATAFALAGGGAGISHDDLRKVIVLREILDRPLALRE